MTYPDYSNAYAGAAAPSGALRPFAHRGGSWQAAPLFAHRGGAWRPVAIWRLPVVAAPATVNGTMSATFGFSAAMNAKPTVTGTMSTGFGFAGSMNATTSLDGSASASFGFSASMTGTAVPPQQAGTTVIFISDLLVGSEVLGTANDTVVLQRCITRLLKRQNAASTANITTPHVTVDWENRYWMSEGTLVCPENGDLKTSSGSGTLGHPCENWPSGMTWRNGGIQSNLDDATSTGGAWNYEQTTTTAPVSVPADTVTTFSVPVVSTAEFTDAGHNFRMGDKDGGFRVHWATKTSTQFNGCTRVAAGTAVVRSSGELVTQNPYSKARDRIHIIFQQSVQRPNATDQWLTLENWWVKGPHNYNKADYDVDREGQECISLRGMQWFHTIDCKLEEFWADAYSLAPHASILSGRSNDVYPGMLNFEGGLIKRPGIMNITMNQCRAPDAVVHPDWWKNGPDYVNVPDNVNNAPSASGTQYGCWWHGNAAHPFRSIDSNRSIIDMEPIGAYGHIQDVTVGGDVDKAHFQITHPLVGGESNFLSAGDAWGLMRRHKFQHIFRDGACRASWGASAAVGWKSTTINSASNGVALPTATIHLNNSNMDDTADGGGVAIRIAGLGWTLVHFNNKSGNDITGCTDGIGTLATGAQVRNLVNFHHTFGAKIAAGSNNVVLPAKGQQLPGGGILNLDRDIHNVFGFGAQNVRVWTDSGLAELSFDTRPTGTTLTNVRVAGIGTGWTLKTGQAVTTAFEDPERAVYTSGQLEVLDFEWTSAATGGPYWGGRHLDGLKVTKCKGPYRATGDAPFEGGELSDVINFNKGGTSRFGDNTFFPV